jgi:hypothetical protein
VRDGKGLGMQNNFGPRNAATFCISTETAPSAKPSQKLTATVPIALSGVSSQAAPTLGPREHDSPGMRKQVLLRPGNSSAPAVIC